MSLFFPLHPGPLGATSRENPCEVGDTLGLFLLVQPSGGKRWQVKHRIHDNKKQLAIGIHPRVGLAEAENCDFPAGGLSGCTSVSGEIAWSACRVGLDG